MPGEANVEARIMHALAPLQPGQGMMTRCGWSYDEGQKDLRVSDPGVQLCATCWAGVEAPEWTEFKTELDSYATRAEQLRRAVQMGIEPRYYVENRPAGPRCAEIGCTQAGCSGEHPELRVLDAFARDREMVAIADQEAADFDAAMANTRCEVLKLYDDFWLKCWECLYALQTNGTKEIEILMYADRLPHNPSPEQIMHVKVVHVEKHHVGG